MTGPRWHSDPLIHDAIEHVRYAWPYYLSAVTQLRIVADPNVPTMATSAAWVTHYNPVQTAAWTVPERAGVLVHELEHLLRRHHDRCGDRDPGRFNIAGDAEINQRLAGLPEGAVYPETLGQPRGRTAEVYYGATQEQDPDPQGGDGEGDGDGSGSGAPGAPGSGPAKCGSAAGGPTQEHEAGDAANPGQGAAQGGDPVRKQTAEQIIAQGGRGTGPGDELREWAEQELHIDRAAWYTALASAVGHTMAPYGAPVRWQWPGRRDIRDMGGAMVPRWTGTRPQCAVVIDTSGSVTPFDLEMAVAAGHYIARVADATFYTCNTQAVNVGTTVPDQLRGGGGTDLTVGIAMAIREGAKAVVVITDCETPWPRTETPVPLIIGANPNAKRILDMGAATPWTPPQWATVLPVVQS